MVYTTEEFNNVAPQFLSHAGQYVYLSSSRVYADSTDPLTEESPRLLDVIKDPIFLSSDEYALTKARQENILFHSGKRNWTIIRPYITYSENRLQLGIMEKEAWLYRAIHKRSIVFYKDVASCTTTLTYGLDVAKGISETICKENALGEVFHITTNDSIKWSDVLDIYCNIINNVLGFTPQVCWIDRAINSLVPSAEISIKYDRLYNRTFDNSKILKLSPDLSFTTPQIGLEQCIKSIIANDTFLHISYGMEALRDRISGDIMPLSEAKSNIDKIKYVIMRYLSPCVTKYLL